MRKGKKYNFFCGKRLHFFSLFLIQIRHINSLEFGKYAFSLRKDMLFESERRAFQSEKHVFSNLYDNRLKIKRL